LEEKSSKVLTAVRANNFASISLKGIETLEEGTPPKNNYRYIGKKRLNITQEGKNHTSSQNKKEQNLLIKQFSNKSTTRHQMNAVLFTITNVLDSYRVKSSHEN